MYGVLESAGYEVELARSGEDGVAQFDPERCSVVISDVVMPGAIDGYALCRHIKNTQAGRYTPVMLLMNLSSPMDIIHGLAAGADNFLTKPYDPAHLVERLGVLLRTREARAEHRLRVGVDIFFMGQTFNITSDREQILDLLISTFEDAVRRNQALRDHQEELTAAKTELARYAATLEARLESVLSSVPDVLFSMQPDLARTQYVSPAAAKVTGYESEEFTRDSGLWLRVMRADDAPVVDALFKRARAGEAGSEQFRVRHRDGTIRWLHATVVPVRDPHGDVTRLDGIARDVTEGRRLEEQFLQAQKMESVGRLAGGVAHDFNNLLSVILGYTGMALSGLTVGHAARESLEEVLKAGEGAARLTRQLLAFSRHQVIESTVFNPVELVVEMDQMLRRLIGEDIKLIIKTDYYVGTVKMDRGQLEQVLMNFVVNARDSMPHGGNLMIEIANAVLDGDYPREHIDVVPGDYVLISVSDSGTGISEEVKRRMFEPFFTTKDSTKGTGLGLATSHGIVKQAGGHIGVYSELGHGTTMKIYLPRRHEMAAAKYRPRRDTPVWGAESILLVEDDEPVRRVMVRMLETQGYRVSSAGAGDEALRLLKEAREPWQLLLTDVVLTGQINGRVLAEQARALRPDIKVLFASGYTNDMSILHGLTEEGVALIQKPFTAESLARKVRQVLETG